MTTEITVNALKVWSFVDKFLSVPITTGMRGIGIERDGEMLAGVLYENFNGVNVFMHVAAKEGARWLTPEFLRYAFYYPFYEMGAERVTGAVEASNLKARQLDEHLGFKEECRMKGAASDGGDLILYVMWKKDWRDGKEIRKRPSTRS